MTSFADNHPGYEIVTEEQAKNLVKEQLDLLPAVARGCNITFPNDGKKTAEFRRSAYRAFLVKHGGVLGQILAFYRCERLRKETYRTLKAEAMSLLGPSLLIDRYGWASHDKETGLTTEQAKAWVVEQIESLDVARTHCNVIFPNDHGKTVDYQKNAERILLVKHGGVLGILVALHRCRRLSDVGYNELRERAMAVLVPTLVGGV